MFRCPVLLVLVSLVTATLIIFLTTRKVDTASAATTFRPPTDRRVGNYPSLQGPRWSSSRHRQWRYGRQAPKPRVFTSLGEGAPAPLRSTLDGCTRRPSRFRPPPKDHPERRTSSPSPGTSLRRQPRTWSDRFGSGVQCVGGRSRGREGGTGKRGPSGPGHPVRSHRISEVCVWSRRDPTKGQNSCAGEGPLELTTVTLRSVRPPKRVGSSSSKRGV